MTGEELPELSREESSLSARRGNSPMGTPDK